MSLITAPARAAAPQLEVAATTRSMIWNAVAVSDGAVYLAGPRWTGSTGPAVARLDETGTPVAYPDASWNAWQEGKDASRSFVDVNALHLDGKGSLWAVDTGSAQFGGDPLPGGAKLVQVNLATHAVTRVIAFGPDIALRGSYVDDVRFHGEFAYITDAGKAGIIVVNLTSGATRRLLENHPSTTARGDRPIVVDGTTVMAPDGKPARVQADPMEVSPDGRWFYFSTLEGPWYRIATKWLEDFSAAPQAVASKVESWADLPPVGGTVMDINGDLYFSDLATSSLKRRSADGQVTTLIQDKRLHWIDAPTIDDRHRIWLPVPQLDRTAPFNGGKSLIQWPVTLYRLELPQHQLHTEAIMSQRVRESSVSNRSLERWRSYLGVSWEAPVAGKDPAPFPNSVNTPICGIHFDAQGRAFVSTPRFITATAPATVSILDTEARTGPARLRAFPSEEGNSVTAAPDQHLRSVLGFYVDQRNGWLWALDQGYVAGEKEAPLGAQKVMVYDLQSGRTVKRIALDDAADRRGSFLNDIVVDEVRKVGYISDSGMRSAPDNQAGIIVVDFDSGTARRILHQHPSVQIVPGVKVYSHGAEVWPGNPLKLAINGIGLSPDGNTLYWTVTTGRHAYALPTGLLHSHHTSDTTLATEIRDIGDVGGNTDGIVTDAAGILYITDLTHAGIVTYDPRTETMSLAASDERVHWPDTATLHPDGDLIFTSSNLNQHFAAAIRPGEERFELWRLKIGGK